MKNKKKKMSLVFVFLLAVTILFGSSENAEAVGTKKIQLNKKSVTLEVGKKKLQMMEGFLLVQ